jgi:predicted O-methyltransferase YrrM
MTRTDIINHLIQIKGYKRYLEIGVQYPKSNYDLINVESKTGVEPHPVGDWESKGIIQATSNEFFEEIKSSEIFDLVFIDGFHERDQCLKDILNSLNHLSEGGTILVHDCLPTEEYQTTIEDNNREWTGDVWKSIVDIKKRDGLEIYTIDTDWGVGFIRRNPNCIGESPDRELDFETYIAFRNQLLNVKSVEEWKSLV